MTQATNSTRSPLRASTRMSDRMRCTLAHIAERGPCVLEELIKKFCEDASSSANYRASLSYLEGAGYLKSTGAGRERHWEIDNSPRQPDSAPMATPAPVPAPVQDPAVWIGSKAPAPCYDLKEAPVYVPEAGPVIRRGALDFKRHASVGHQC